LDPTTRRVRLPGGEEALFTDTVGFIHKLPTQLVAAFRATLEEIGESDLILHVVDAAHPNIQAQVTVVAQTLSQIGAGDKPVIMALNKIDKVTQEDAGTENQLEPMFDMREDAIPISALRMQGLDRLLERIEKRLAEGLETLHLLIPYREHDLVGLFHQRGIIEREENVEQGTAITGKVSLRLVERFKPFLIDDGDETAVR
jgi:GTP-binding protein HflX